MKKSYPKQKQCIQIKKESEGALKTKNSKESNLKTHEGDGIKSTQNPQIVNLQNCSNAIAIAAANAELLALQTRDAADRLAKQIHDIYFNNQ